MTITSIVGTVLFLLVGFTAAYISRWVLSIALLGGLIYGSLKALETVGQKTELIKLYDEKIVQHGKVFGIGIYEFLSKLISSANEVYMAVFLTGCLLGLFFSLRRRA